MADETDGDRRVSQLEWAMWGVSGRNGIVGDVKAIRAALDEQQKERLNSQRAVILALLAAVIALIGTTASLVVALGA